jgi:hypothetical protein
MFSKLFFKPKTVNFAARSFHAAKPLATNYRPTASVSLSSGFVSASVNNGADMVLWDDAYIFRELCPSIEKFELNNFHRLLETPRCIRISDLPISLNAEV